MIASVDVDDLEHVAQDAADGALQLPVARIVPLSDAIAALTKQERSQGTRSGKLVITND